MLTNDSQQRGTPTAGASEKRKVPTGCVKNTQQGAGEMDQQLGVLADLPNDLSLISSIHMVAYDCLQP